MQGVFRRFNFFSPQLLFFFLYSFLTCSFLIHTKYVPMKLIIIARSLVNASHCKLPCKAHNLFHSTKACPHSFCTIPLDRSSYIRYIAFPMVARNRTYAHPAYQFCSCPPQGTCEAKIIVAWITAGSLRAMLFHIAFLHLLYARSNTTRFQDDSNDANEA